MFVATQFYAFKVAGSLTDTYILLYFIHAVVRTALASSAAYFVTRLTSQVHFHPTEVRCCLMCLATQIVLNTI